MDEPHFSFFLKSFYKKGFSLGFRRDTLEKIKLEKNRQLTAQPIYIECKYNSKYMKRYNTVKHVKTALLGTGKKNSVLDRCSS